MSIKNKIIEKIHEVAGLTDSIIVSELSDETVLLASGLDSLGFAVLVAVLEEEFDFDPFVELEDAVYPETLGEFVAIYSNID